MFVFGHLGVTLGAFHSYQRLKKVIKKNHGDLAQDSALDYRALFIGSLLPDIIDKPLGLLYPKLFTNNTRLAAHTLWGCLLIAVFVWLKTRKTKNPKVVMNANLFVCGYWFHMVLDRMWRAINRPVFFWPFLGQPHAYFDTALERWKHPRLYTITGEILGLFILIIFVRAKKLYFKNNLIRFLKTGEYLN